MPRILREGRATRPRPFTLIRGDGTIGEPPASSVTPPPVRPFTVGEKHFLRASADIPSLELRRGDLVIVDPSDREFPVTWHRCMAVHHLGAIEALAQARVLVSEEHCS